MIVQDYIFPCHSRELPVVIKCVDYFNVYSLFYEVFFAVPALGKNMSTNVLNR